ncbi:MAG: hypothetical protein M0P47_03725 [Bacteroidales bacterium]|jgi:hypothetical protein|nr:hypothetical protein [Bacteroidales bacterium]
MKKTTLLFSVILVVFAGTCKGQAVDSKTSKSGLYMTSDDFSKGKLTYETNCLNNRNSIKNSDFDQRKTVRISYHDSTFKLAKSSIWGYRLCNGKEYRIFKNQEFEIIDRSSIIIYQKHYIRNMNPRGNNSSHTISYFFSEKSDSPLKELNLSNLESSFPTNKKFHDLIDLYFKSDEELLIYDDYYKMYRVNHFYFESLK